MDTQLKKKKIYINRNNGNGHFFRVVLLSFRVRSWYIFFFPFYLVICRNNNVVYYAHIVLDKISNELYMIVSNWDQQIVNEINNWSVSFNLLTKY